MKQPKRLPIIRPRFKNLYMNQRVGDFMSASSDDDDDGPEHDTSAIGFLHYEGEYEGTAHDLHHYTDATPAGFTET